MNAALIYPTQKLESDPNFAHNFANFAFLGQLPASGCLRTLETHARVVKPGRSHQFFTSCELFAFRHCWHLIGVCCMFTEILYFYLFHMQKSALEFLRGRLVYWTSGIDDKTNYFSSATLKALAIAA